MRFHVFGPTVACLLLAATISSVSSRSAPPKHFSSALEQSAQVLLATKISEWTINRLEKNLRDLSVGQSPKGTLLPPYDDPACVEPSVLELNVRIPEIPLGLLGTLALTSAGTVTGLSQIVDEFEFFYNAITGTATASWNFALPSVSISGEFDANVLFDIGYPSDILGSGALLASSENVRVSLDGKLRAPAIGKMGLNELHILDLGLDNLSIEAEVSLNGTSIDTATLSGYLQTYLDTIWNEETRPLITEIVRCSVDHVINDCNVVQIVEGNTECLKEEINPECLPESFSNQYVNIHEKSAPFQGLCQVEETTIVA